MREKQRFEIIPPKKRKAKAIVKVAEGEAWTISFGLELLSEQAPGRYHESWVKNAKRLLDKYQDLRSQLEEENAK
jgi:hypothetical protein